MSAVLTLATDGVTRRIGIAISGSSFGFRALHRTPSGLFPDFALFLYPFPAHNLIKLTAARKARNISDASQTDEAEDDLFPASDISSTSANSSDRSARRLELIRIISAASILPTREKKRVMSSTRVGTLRKIVQFCDTPEELEDIRGALRGWRVMGMRVTAKTAEEIVGRCLSLPHPPFQRVLGWI